MTQPYRNLGGHDYCRHRPPPRDGRGFSGHRAVGCTGDTVGFGRPHSAVPDGCHDVRGRCCDRRRARLRARRGAGLGVLVGFPPRLWLLGVGGLFGYHALYFAALQLAPPAEANLVNYLWPLLIVLLSAPLAGERLGWPHLLGALLGFVGVALLALSRGVTFTGTYALGYALALSCAFTWSLYSVLSRRFGETPTDAISAFCTVSAALSLLCHLMFERTVWPGSTTAWLAVLALGLGPAGSAFYLWDHAVKRGDIRALGALSYATPILSTALLIVCGVAEPTIALLLAALLVTAGAVLASRDLWLPARRR